MKNIFIPAIIVAALAVSCSTGKNLKEAEQQNATLKVELAKMQERDADLNIRVTALGEKVAQLEVSADAYQNELKKANASRSVAELRFNELSKCLEEQSDSLFQIKRKAIKELSSFNNTLVKVKYQNGMVYISMQDQFMFPSGSTEINTEGKKALAVIADLLFEYDHFTAIVVGNTDTVRVTRGFRDNWSLSTERSNAIVRYLIDHYKVNPARLISAGRSRFSPVANNGSPEGRAKNRRTDIIFNPDLNKLWLLSQKYPE